MVSDNAEGNSNVFFRHGDIVEAAEARAYTKASKSSPLGAIAINARRAVAAHYAAVERQRKLLDRALAEERRVILPTKKRELTDPLADFRDGTRPIPTQLFQPTSYTRYVAEVEARKALERKHGLAPPETVQPGQSHIPTAESEKISNKIKDLIKLDRSFANKDRLPLAPLFRSTLRGVMDLYRVPEDQQQALLEQPLGEFAYGDPEFVPAVVARIISGGLGAYDTALNAVADGVTDPILHVASLHDKPLKDWTFQDLLSAVAIGTAAVSTPGKKTLAQAALSFVSKVLRGIGALGAGAVRTLILGITGGASFALSGRILDAITRNKNIGPGNGGNNGDDDSSNDDGSSDDGEDDTSDGDSDFPDDSNPDGNDDLPPQVEVPTPQTPIPDLPKSASRSGIGAVFATHEDKIPLCLTDPKLSPEHRLQCFLEWQAKGVILNGDPIPLGNR
jgi:hypothetical protein